MIPEVVVYTRQGCKLCATAERIVHRVAAGRATVTLIDIDQNPELYERYTVRVPVIAVDGREIAELQVFEDDLRAALESLPQPDVIGGDADHPAPRAPRRRSGNPVKRAITWLSRDRR